MRRDLLYAAAGFAAALAVRAAILALFPFDGLYGQDAYAYYDFAVVWRAALARGVAPPPFVWPLGYPLHIVLLSIITGMIPAAAQWASLLAGAAIAPLVYAVTREALWQAGPEAGRRAGLAAALVTIPAAQLVVSSISAMADTTALAWATLSAWLVLRYARTTRPLDLALAGLALGVAVVTRWGNALLVVPWVLAVLLAWRARQPAIETRQVLAAAALAVLCGGAVVGAQLTTGSHTGYLELYGWDPANAVRNSITTDEGHYTFALPPALYYAQPLLHPSFLFPLLAPFWGPGLYYLARRAGLPARVLLAGWPLILYLFLIGGTRENPRYSLAYLPALAAWAGIGFDWLWRARAAWRRAAVVLFIAALLGAGAWTVRSAGNFVAASKTFPLAQANYAADRLPSGARVLTFGLTLTLSHYTDLEAVDLYYESPGSLARLACDGTATFLYVDPANLSTQWRDLVPDVNYRSVMDSTGAEEIGRFGEYVLYRVGAACVR